MSRSRLVILAALVALMAVPVGTVLAQEEPATEGTALIWNNVAFNDAITYAMTNVPAPPEGTEYVGWLISDDGAIKLSTGPMALADDGSINHTFDSESNRYTGENLIQNFSTVAITPEVIGADPDEPAAAPLFVDQVPLWAMAHIRHLLSDWLPGSGSGIGILNNLNDQLEAALTHANLALGSADLDGIRTHTWHVINIIEGPDGDNYDISFGDPGDKVGVVTHAQNRKHGGFAAGTVPGDEIVNTNAERVDIAGANAEAFALQARDNALTKVLPQTDMALAKLRLGGVTSLLESALDGLDADADGAIEYIGGDEAEAASLQAYTAAQAMATYSFGAQAHAPEFQPTGDPAIPLMAQFALIAAVALIGVGGSVVLWSRRSRKTA